MSDTIIITGSTGFIGKSLIKLLHDSYNIIPCSREDCDLTKSEDFRQFVEQQNVKSKNLYLIHCAAHNSFKEQNNMDDPNIIANNIKIHAAVINCKSLFNHIFMFGSGSESSRSQSIAVPENIIIDPPREDNYGLSKWIISNSIFNEIVYGGKITWLRLFGCFGPLERKERFFKNNINRALQGLEIEVNSNSIVDFFSIYDVASVIEKCIKDNINPGIINMVYNKKRTLIDLANIIRMNILKCPGIHILKNSPTHYYGEYGCLENFNLLGLNESVKQMIYKA
tara:strand:- start:482 stop:1327 length:846 start_codon:yes stop_codon:yes gene_type:complete